MRHLRSILYTIVLAPAVWILCGVGFTSDLVGRARDSDSVESLAGLLILLLAGGAYAILVFTPLSPAGPSFAGLVFLGTALWALASPGSYGDAWPAGVAKEGFDLSRPGYGLAALLAVPLLCTALSAQRWERYVPPQFALIGTLGRVWGAAAVAGTPVSAADTAVIEVPPGTVPGAADATQVLISGPAVAAVVEVSDSTEAPSETVADLDRPTDAIVDPEQPTLAVAQVPAGQPSTAPVNSAPDPDTDDQPTHAIDGGGTTQVLNPGELTQVIPLGVPAAADHGEKTQVIGLAEQHTEALDGDRTQLIRSGTPTVEPPGDRTQVLTFPAQDTQARKVPGEQTTVSHEAPTRPHSIVAEERPNPSEDPTTRLVPPPNPGQETTEQPSEATTVDVGDGKRATTVTSLERPADEADDDTRELGAPPIPVQRRPSPDET